MGGGVSKGTGPSVIVVGCGHGGSVAARTLDKEHCRVIVIERAQYMTHKIAALRAVVDPSVEEQIVIPINNVVTPGVGAVIHGEVQAITADPASPCGASVNVGGHILRPEYLVIATGSAYSFPGKIGAPLAADALQTIRTSRDVLKRCTKIAIIGGGPVGCELAGEIRHYFPDKQVTIIQGQPKLVAGTPLSETFQNAVQQTLERDGVQLILGDRLASGEDTVLRDSALRYLEGPRVLRTTGGRQLEVDLVFSCVGSNVNSNAYANTLQAAVQENGKLQVNEFLQVQGFTRVFALGDCSNAQMEMAYYAKMQAAHIVKNVMAIHRGKPPTPYVKPAPLMLVPVGPKHGAGVIGGRILGNTLTSMIKGKGLFISASWKDLRATMPKGRPQYSLTNVVNENAAPEKVKQRAASLVAALKLDQQTAEALARGVPIPPPVTATHS